MATNDRDVQNPLTTGLIPYSVGTDFSKEIGSLRRMGDLRIKILDFYTRKIIYGFKKPLTQLDDGSFTIDLSTYPYNGISDRYILTPQTNLIRKTEMANTMQIRAQQIDGIDRYDGFPTFLMPIASLLYPDLYDTVIDIDYPFAIYYRRWEKKTADASETFDIDTRVQLYYQDSEEYNNLVVNPRDPNPLINGYATIDVPEIESTKVFTAPWFSRCDITTPYVSLGSEITVENLYEPQILRPGNETEPYTRPSTGQEELVQAEVAYIFSNGLTESDNYGLEPLIDTGFTNDMRLALNYYFPAVLRYGLSQYSNNNENFDSDKTPDQVSFGNYLFYERPNHFHQMWTIESFDTAIASFSQYKTYLLTDPTTQLITPDDSDYSMWCYVYAYPADFMRELQFETILTVPGTTINPSRPGRVHHGQSYARNGTQHTYANIIYPEADHPYLLGRNIDFGFALSSLAYRVGSKIGTFVGPNALNYDPVNFNYPGLPFSNGWYLINEVARTVTIYFAPTGLEDSENPYTDVDNPPIMGSQILTFEEITDTWIGAGSP